MRSEIIPIISDSGVPSEVTQMTNIVLHHQQLISATDRFTVLVITRHNLVRSALQRTSQQF
jgi:hypothetical protein